MIPNFSGRWVKRLGRQDPCYSPTDASGRRSPSTRISSRHERAWRRSGRLSLTWLGHPAARRYSSQRRGTCRRLPSPLPDLIPECEGWGNELGSLARESGGGITSSLAWVDSRSVVRRCRSRPGPPPGVARVRSPRLRSDFGLRAIVGVSISASERQSRHCEQWGVAGPDIVATRANPAQPQAPSPFRFTEIAQQAGIEFVHFSGMTKDKHFPTANGSGVALFD